MKPEPADQNNSINNSSKLLLYIDHAKNWLDKAKNEYNHSNSVRGELILSLAQAEVKRAWELSREQCVSTFQEPSPAAVRKNSFLLPLAAGFGILLLIAGAFFLVKLQHAGMAVRGTGLVSVVTPAPSKGSIAGQPIQSQPVTPVIPLAAALPEIPVKSAAIHPIVVKRDAHRVVREMPLQKKAVVEPAVAVTAPQTVPKEVPVIQDAPVVKEVPVIKEASVVKEVPVIKEASVVKEVPVVKEAPNVATVENPRKNAPVRAETPANGNSGRIQPAFQLPEDDLANIAKRSLQSGR